MDVGIARFGTGDDVGLAIAVEVPGGDSRADVEGGIGDKVADRRPVQIDTAEHANPRIVVNTSANASAGNDVKMAIAIDVASGNEHARGHVRTVGEELRE